METYVRYRGEFLSQAGVRWRVEILQRAEAPFAQIGELTFEGDSPLVIEWNHSDKESTICGSAATLRIESPGDRTYADLYTEEPGAIRLDVYREGELYWSGALDPEFYEEPYERADKYPVELTFSDFGALERLQYNKSGMLTLRDIMELATAECGINTVLDESLISTCESGDEPLSLSDLKVRSENFYDEDGEASTLKEVVGGILQPLGLRIEQRCGKTYIYDLNALYHKADIYPVYWNGDSQTLGTDVVYNNVKITWDPYSEADEMLPEEYWTEPTDANKVNINNLVPIQDGNCWYISHFIDDMAILHGGIALDRDAVGFTFWFSSIGQNATLGIPAACFFKTISQLGGDTHVGVAARWCSAAFYFGGSPTLMPDSEFVERKFGVQTLHGAITQRGDLLFSTEHIQLPPVSDPDDLCLRITMETLLDNRYNFNEPAQDFGGQHNQESDQKKWKEWLNYYYVPVTIRYKPNNGDEELVWEGYPGTLPEDRSYFSARFSRTFGKWSKLSDYRGYGWLAYYDKNDRGKSSAAFKWSANRPLLPPTNLDIDGILQRVEDGQYIPYPPNHAGGEIWIEVYSGWMISEAGNILEEVLYDSKYLSNGGKATESQINRFKKHEEVFDKMAWALCKPPQIEILNRSNYSMEIDSDDVEYNAEINPKAKNELAIDTICGSAPGGVPTARGAYFSAATGLQITELTRAGRTTQIEELLVGTIYSQFATRHTTLSGDMAIADRHLHILSEQNQGSRRFMLVSDTQDLISDTSDAVLTEFRPDEYDKED